MSALDELLKDISHYDEVDVVNHLLHWREHAAAELAALNARVAELESEKRFIDGIVMGDGDHDKTMLVKDAMIFMQCMKLLGLDVTSSESESIVDEIENLKARVKQAEENWQKNEARVAKLQESIEAAKIQLEATQRNWDEDCLFRCNDILVDALKGAE